MKVLFLVEAEPRRGMSPAARFRVYQLVPHLERQGIRCHVMPSRPSKYCLARPRVARLVAGRPGLAASALVGASAIMTLTRLAALVRAPAYDVVVFQRDLLPLRTLPPLLERAIMRRNRHVVFDFDDAIFERMRGRSEVRRLPSCVYDPEKIGHILQRCCAVVAGNEYLADYARHWNNAVSVIPTVVDTDVYTPRVHGATTGPVTIGWMGTHSNLEYLAALSPVLRELASRVPVRLLVVSNWHTETADLAGVPLERRTWSVATEHADLCSFDIGIMPLPDDPWTRGKCGFKALLYMACGVPAVISPVGVDAQIVTSGMDGFTATSAREWLDVLERLASDAALRRQIGERGRETVVKRFSARRWVPELARVLHEAAG